MLIVGFKVETSVRGDSKVNQTDVSEMYSDSDDEVERCDRDELWSGVEGVGVCTI